MNRPPTSDSAARDWMLFLLASIYLIASFLWRFIVVAHEADRQTVILLTIGVDVLAIVSLILLYSRLSKGNLLFWIALIAGVGLLAMRANGETGWWSGHLMFTLCPREDDAIVCHCRDQISLTFLCPQ